MENNLNWINLVGTNHTLEDGGYIGGLLLLARAHIADAIKKNEITQAQAGEIYTAMIPGAFETGLAFSMK